MEKEYSTITYSLYFCLNPRLRSINRQWELEMSQLSETDIRSVAKGFKFRKKSIDKLINHTSKGFTYIRKKEYEIVKTFHPQPVEIISSLDDRQPLNKRLKALKIKRDDQQNQ